MLKLPIPQLGDETLFEATLEPTASAVDKLVERKDMDELEINTFRGKKNKVAVGVPYYENLISRYNTEDQEISHEIKQMLPNYDFHFVSLNCTLLPDPDCRFSWVRFGVELSARSRSDELLEEKPIAWDMFPDEVSSEITCMNETNFSPELKLKLGVADVDMKLVDIRTQKKYIVYEPQIFAGGFHRSNVSWNFKRTAEKEIVGNKRNLLLIVRTPKYSKVKGRFLLGAEVEFNIGKWIPIPLHKRKDEAGDDPYDLSE